MPFSNPRILVEGSLSLRIYKTLYEFKGYRQQDDSPHNIMLDAWKVRTLKNSFDMVWQNTLSHQTWSKSFLLRSFQCMPKIHLPFLGEGLPRFLLSWIFRVQGTKGISCTRNKAMMESKELWFTSVSSPKHMQQQLYSTHAIPFRKKHVHMADGSEIGINMDTQLPARREFRILKKSVPNNRDGKAFAVAPNSKGIRLKYALMVQKSGLQAPVEI